MKVFEVRLMLSLMKAHLKPYLLVTASRSNRIRKGLPESERVGVR